MTTTTSNLNSMESPSPLPPKNPPKLSTWEAFQSFDLSESLKGRFARVPCQRKALLFGLVGGSAIGGLRLISTKRVRSSANWGFYSFIFLSSISFYNCNKKHEVEVQQIQTVVEKLNQLKQKELSSNLTNQPTSTSKSTEQNGSKGRDGNDLIKSENSDTTSGSNLPASTSSTAPKKSWWFW